MHIAQKEEEIEKEKQTMDLSGFECGYDHDRSAAIRHRDLSIGCSIRGNRSKSLHHRWDSYDWKQLSGT